jgi:hypothetical protein
VATSVIGRAPLYSRRLFALSSLLLRLEVDGRRHKHLAGTRDPDDPRSHVHDEPTGLPVSSLEFPEGDRSSDLDPEFPNRLDCRYRASDRIARTLERDEEPVTRGIDLAASESLDRASKDRVGCVGRSARPIVRCPSQGRSRLTRRCR